MEFLIASAVIIGVSIILSELFERVGLVSVLGEFGTGLLLGVSFLALFSAESIEIFASMGVILLLFLAGYEETDLRFLIREHRKLFLISFTSLFLGLVGTFLFALAYFSFTFKQAIFFALAFVLTDVAVGAKTVISMGKTQDPLGKNLLGIAILDTVIGLILLAVAITLVTSNSILGLISVFAKILLFILVIVTMGRVLPVVIHKSVKMGVEETEFSIAFITIFLLAFLAEELGLAAVMGAYFAGIILQHSRELESRHFSETMKSMAYGFFVPLFFAWMGLQTDLSYVPIYFKEIMVIVFFTLGIKFVGTLAAAQTYGLSLKEGLTYGFGLVSRGADNLVVLAIAISLGIFAGVTELLLAATAVLMVVSIIISSIGLKRLL